MPCDVLLSESEADRKERKRYGMGLGLGFRGIPMWVHVTLGLVAAAAWLVPRLILTNARITARSMDGIGFASAEAEPWSKKPVKEWPQFLLVNEAELKGVPKSTGGAAFLVEQPDGHILGATSSRRQALGNPEDEPSMTNAELNERFVSWRMFPASATDPGVIFRGFYGNPANHSDGDVWLLQTDALKAQLPATPLKVRRNALVRGMRLSVVTRLADDPSGKQQVFPCTVQGVAMEGEITELVFDQAVVCRGFRGFPVIDQQGHLAGIVTGPAEEPREDGAVTWIRAVGLTGLHRMVK